MSRYSKYGLTDDDYEQLREFQNEACAACGRTFTARRYACVDHSHRTGNVRGLLCNRCNGLLGVINEDRLLLDGLLQYLRQPPANLLWAEPRRHRDAPPLEYVQDLEPISWKASDHE